MVKFTAEHAAFRATVRDFVDTEIQPHVDEWEAAGIFPAHELFAKLAKIGALGLEYDPEYGGGGADHLFTVVLCEELGRIDAGGPAMGIGVQIMMATPSLHEFGTHEQKQRFLVPALRGEAVAAIAVTELGAGSDVVGIRTRVVHNNNK